LRHIAPTLPKIVRELINFDYFTTTTDHYGL
jgi:hypothetical protein